MPLPTEKRAAVPGLGKVLGYGPAKVGKSTTFATMDPDNTILLDLEQGSSAIEGFVHPLKSWGDAVAADPSKPPSKDNPLVLRDDSFRGTIKLLAESPGRFTTGVVDTVDVLAQLSGDYVLRALSGGNPAQYAHASDFEYGKGWSAWREEFELRIGALCRVLPNVVFISHTNEKSLTDRTGAEYTVFTPALAPKGINEWLTGFVDHILFFELGENGERLLRTQPTRQYQAGGRTPLGAPTLPDPIVLPPENPGGALKSALEALSAPKPADAPVAKPAARNRREKAQEAPAASESEQGQLGTAA